MRDTRPRFSGALLIFASLLCSGCRPAPAEPALQLIQIVDQQDVVETISNRGRLRQLQRREFAAPQPYKKVLRSYCRDAQHRQRGIISSYYPNGNLMQWLEICDGRAAGDYREWHLNGEIKICAQIVGGIADLTPLAQESWQFDQTCKAFDQKGQLLAQVHYCRGQRQGLEKRFWPTGALRAEIPFHEGSSEGVCREFDQRGHLLQCVSYRKGRLHGRSLRYWPAGTLAHVEDFEGGRLRRGRYWTFDGRLAGRVECGSGQRVLFVKGRISERQTYRGGEQTGSVAYYSDDHQLERIAEFQGGRKEGKEVLFHALGVQRDGSCDRANRPIPKLEMHWRGDRLQGTVRTWFVSGRLRSCHERSQNLREGNYTCYYPDGQVMFLEQYRQDRLLAGQYFALGERTPCSAVVEGRGIATLFDERGNLTHQINYTEGWPLQKAAASANICLR